MKIICFGLTYKNHIKEMGSEIPSEPVFFMKPDTALLRKNQPMFYPNFTKDLQYECEIVLKIGKVGKSISEKYAKSYIHSIGIGIDFTARDIQKQQKDMGLPWEKAKAFDNSAPISYFIPTSNFKDIQNIDFKLFKNDELVQHGNTNDMIFSFEKLVSHVSEFVTLKTGDLIFTGTPSGVGPVKIGDRLEAFLEGNIMLSCDIK